MAISDIQEFVNKKAERRLDKDLADLSQYICNHPLIKGTEGVKLAVLKETGKKGELATELTGKTSLLRLLYSSSSELTREIKAVMLPIYIKKESEALTAQWDNIMTKAIEVSQKLNELTEILNG